MQAGLSYFDKEAPSIAIRSLFDKYDSNRNGKLEESELQTFLEGDLGLDRQQSWIYFLLIDKSGDRDISFEEFHDWLRSGEHFQILSDRRKFHSILKALRYFKRFDTNDSDTLDRGQFEHMMLFFGYHGIDMDRAFVKMDRHKNGKVSFWEFLVWVKWVPIYH